jgi:hypothetical protein
VSADRRSQTNHLQVGQELFDRANNDEKFLKTYYGNDIEKETPSLPWVSKTSHRAKRARKFGQMRKCCLFFLGVNVLFTMNFLPRDHTINKEIKCLREAMRR